MHRAGGCGDQQCPPGVFLEDTLSGQAGFPERVGTESGHVESLTALWQNLKQQRVPGIAPAHAGHKRTRHPQRKFRPGRVESVDVIGVEFEGSKQFL